MEQNKDMQEGVDTDKILEIRRILAKNGIIPTDEQLYLLGQYVVNLREQNKKVNLVSRRDVDNLWESHILHSLAPVLEVRIPQGARVLDLGSGGGLPGIPIRLIRPDLKVTLLDATRKKVDAVREILVRLNLTGVQIIWGRAEDEETAKRLAGQFDVVVARAVAPLIDLITWSSPLISPQAMLLREVPHVLALKGGDLQEELDKVRRSGRVRDVRSKELTFPGAEMVPGIQKQIVTAYF